MEKTKIDWCESTWNPVTGCLHNCQYCYARTIANRFGFHASEPDINERVLLEMLISVGRKVPYPFDFQPTLHRYRLDEYREKKGRNIFVCSMADLFGSWVPDSWIEEVFGACDKALQHNYLFLSKNPQRYLDLEASQKLPNKENMWYGTTITNKDTAFAWFNSEVKFHWFLSVEPILEDLGELKADVMPEWIIVGAETGTRKDKVIPEKSWIENLLDECRKYNIPLFMKSNLAEIWGEPLIQKFPEGLRRKE